MTDYPDQIVRGLALKGETCHSKKGKKNWNQNLEDKDTVFNRIDIDYADAEKTKPCSIKFKTDNIAT